MITIRPTTPPRTEWVRRATDQKWVKWVEKNISTLTDEPVTQVSPVSKTGEHWPMTTTHGSLKMWWRRGEGEGNE